MLLSEMDGVTVSRQAEASSFLDRLVKGACGDGQGEQSRVASETGETWSDD